MLGNVTLDIANPITGGWATRNASKRKNLTTPRHNDITIQPQESMIGADIEPNPRSL
jgi:hypothetical protein